MQSWIIATQRKASKMHVVLYTTSVFFVNLLFQTHDPTQPIINKNSRPTTDPTQPMGQPNPYMDNSDQPSSQTDRQTERGQYSASHGKIMPILLRDLEACWLNYSSLIVCCTSFSLVTSCFSVFFSFCHYAYGEFRWIECFRACDWSGAWAEREREGRGAGAEQRAGVTVGLSDERQIGRSRSAHVLCLLLFGFGTNCWLLSLCLLPSRPSSLDW